eukprot:13471-Heterococcus_DN1.PRE.3
MCLINNNFSLTNRLTLSPPSAQCTEPIGSTILAPSTFVTVAHLSLILRALYSLLPLQKRKQAISSIQSCAMFSKLQKEPL